MEILFEKKIFMSKGLFKIYLYVNIGYFKVFVIPQKS